MTPLLTTAALVLIGSQLSAAAPLVSPPDSPPDSGVPKTCRDFAIPVPVTSSNLKFGLAEFWDDFDVVDFVDTITSRDPAAAGSVVAPERETVSATYEISGTICRPLIADKKENTLLIATHGLNFDRSYWNPPGLDPSKYTSWTRPSRGATRCCTTTGSRSGNPSGCRATSRSWRTRSPSWPSSRALSRPESMRSN